MDCLCDKIRATPESYFEWVVLALLGDQFYLVGSAKDQKDVQLLCGPDDVERVAGDLAAAKLQLPSETADRARRIDFRPAVRIDGDAISVRVVIFTRWFGFSEEVYNFDRQRLDEPLDIQRNTLVEYKYK